MDTGRLSQLVEAYRSAPPEYRATSYWQAYEDEIVSTIPDLDLDQLRSGRYPILSKIGFHDVVYPSAGTASIWKRGLSRLAERLGISGPAALPYGLDLRAIREAAYRHCELAGTAAAARPVSDIEMSIFGNPADLFEIDGRRYSVHFLAYYLRYAFAHRYVPLKGDEIVVELGPGSGHQIEVLKKLYPDLTVLCFDLPAHVFLCQAYLTEALSPEMLLGTDATVGWTDLSGLRKGHVHFFGNWQFPLIEGLEVDVFWNAASFGEMEPDVVQNYLRSVAGNARWIYLLQARSGKETAGKARVRTPIAFADYVRFLPGHELCAEEDAWLPHRRMSQSGGYFQAVWRKSSDA